MIRLALIGAVSSASVVVPALLLAAPERPVEIDTRAQNKNQEVREFGTHDRPWASDVLSDDYRQSSAEEEIEKRGLAQSQREIQEALEQKEPPIPAARVSSMAAVTEVLATISEERDKLAIEWSKLADGKAEVALANRRALEEIERLQDLRAEVTALLDELQAQEDENLARVVDVVGNMSAKNAARLLQENEVRFIVLVFDQLGERDAADILSRMQTDKANDVMAMMADRGRPDQTAAL
ncbi:MAG: hypothetical protein AAF788_01640 [Pseudomonadota bacterium]